MKKILDWNILKWKVKKKITATLKEESLKKKVYINLYSAQEYYLTYLMIVKWKESRNIFAMEEVYLFAQKKKFKIERKVKMLYNELFELLLP